jgi:hypothetical protein
MLTVPQLAKRLGYTPRHMQRLAPSAPGASLSVGGHWRFDESAVGFAEWCGGGAPVAEIQQLYSSSKLDGEKIARASVAQMNRARIMGLQLAGLKQSSRAGFSKLFTVDSNGVKNNNPRLHFSQNCGRFFMRIAKAHPSKFVEFSDAFSWWQEWLKLEAKERSRASRG